MKKQHNYYNFVLQDCTGKDPVHHFNKQPFLIQDKTDKKYWFFELEVEKADVKEFVEDIERKKQKYTWLLSYEDPEDPGRHAVYASSMRDGEISSIGSWGSKDPHATKVYQKENIFYKVFARTIVQLDSEGDCPELQGGMLGRFKF